MGVSDNNYTKKEDKMMWELHRIRDAMAAPGITPVTVSHINKNARILAEQYGIKQPVKRKVKTS